MVTDGYATSRMLLFFVFFFRPGSNETELKQFFWLASPPPPIVGQTPLQRLWWRESRPCRVCARHGRASHVTSSANPGINPESARRPEIKAHHRQTDRQTNTLAITCTIALSCMRAHACTIKPGKALESVALPPKGPCVGPSGRPSATPSALPSESTWPSRRPRSPRCRPPGSPAAACTSGGRPAETWLAPPPRKAGTWVLPRRPKRLADDFVAERY